jgi:hypothetical protein
MKNIFIIGLILYFIILWILFIKIHGVASARCSESDIDKLERNKPGLKWRKLPQYNKNESIKFFLFY